MHIVLSGYYGFDNVGDEAILFSIITALQSEQADIEITVLSSNPSSTKRTFNVHAVNRNNIREISRVIKKCDGLISGGGSLLQDVTGRKSIPYYTSIMLLAKFYKKPVFIYAQGMGPINGSWSKRLVAFTLNKVERITVRDEHSRELLQQIGVKQLPSIVPDPVLGLDGTLFAYDGKLPNKPFIAVSVRDWKTDTQYIKKIAGCLDKLASEGYAIIFVPMHGIHDEITSKETAAAMEAPSEIVPHELSMKEKIAIIGKSKLLIGMRLHALIFSAITYTPFIAISYDPKIDAFTAMFDEPVVGHVSEDDWDTEKLYAHTREKLQMINEAEKSIKIKVEDFQKTAANTAAQAIQLFK